MKCKWKRVEKMGGKAKRKRHMEDELLRGKKKKVRPEIKWSESDRGEGSSGAVKTAQLQVPMEFRY